MSRRPLILTSSRPSATESRPRRDFDLLAEALGAAISYPGAASRPVAAVEGRLRVDISQALRARRSDASLYISFSERVGMPMAMLRPDVPHLLLAHLLTTAQKRATARATGYLRRTDLTLAYSRPQVRYLREQAGLDPARARFISEKVDHRFYAPAAEADGGYILSVGREQRDYQTLVDAIAPLRLPCVIVAGSTWSHRTLAPVSLPDTFEQVDGLTYTELRSLYRRARIVVVPVYAGVDYAAGITTVLEAMACARPAVVSDTPGLEGYVRDGVDGRVVTPGDALALRAVIEELWEDRPEADRLGAAARQTVEREHTPEQFVDRITALVETLDPIQPRP